MLSGRRKLLLADDSPTIQKVVSLTFGDEGVEVVAVGDGESALRALAEEPPPDVLLADVVMPGPDGYALCEYVKRDSRLGHVPVVLLVGTFEPFNEAEARRVGADTVLTKPFQSIRDMVSKVGSLFGGGTPREEREPGRARDEGAPLGTPAAATPHAGAHAAPPAREDAEFGAAPDERVADSSASFADLSADDELIEARPADSYGAAAGASGLPPRQETQRAFAEAHDEPGLQVTAPSESGGVVASPAFGAAGAEVLGRRRADRGVVEAEERLTERSQADEVLTELNDERAMHETTSPKSSFDARAEGAANADDTLLDLGQVDSPATASADEADDFILDLGLDDEPPAERAASEPAGDVFGESVFEAAPAAHHAWADAPSAFAEAAHGEQQARPFAEAPAAEAASPFGAPTRVDEFEVTFGEESQPAAAHAAQAEAEEPLREVVMQDGPQGFAFGGEEPQAMSAAPRGFVEPEVVPAAEPAHAFVEPEFTDGSVEGDVSRPPSPQAPSAAGFAVGEARSGVEEAPRAGQLTPEQIDAIARRVVELMSDKVVREVAWDVVPELAELIIRQRLDEDRKQ